MNSRTKSGMSSTPQCIHRVLQALCNFNLLSKCRGSTSVQKKSDGC